MQQIYVLLVILIFKIFMAFDKKTHEFWSRNIMLVAILLIKRKTIVLSKKYLQAMKERCVNNVTLKKWKLGLNYTCTHR